MMTTKHVAVKFRSGREVTFPMPPGQTLSPEQMADQFIALMHPESRAVSIGSSVILLAEVEQMTFVGQMSLV